VIKKLIDKRICYVWEELIEKFKEKKQNFIRLQEKYQSEEALADLLNHWKKAPKQMDLLLAYLHLQRTEGEVEQAALLKNQIAIPPN